MIEVLAGVIILGWLGGLLYLADGLIAIVKRIATKRRGVTADATDHPAGRGRRALDVEPDSDAVPEPAAFAAADAVPVTRH